VIVRMFKPRFAPQVKGGTKTQTTRPTTKLMPKVGDKISLRKWSEKPYRSKQIVLKESVVEFVSRITITENRITINDSVLEHTHKFAQLDGFCDFDEMKLWFKQEHGPLPFSGIIIYWE